MLVIVFNFILFFVIIEMLGDKLMVV